MEFEVGGKKAYAYTAAHDLDPGKPTVVFVHGAGLDHSWWGLQSRYFGYHGFNVLAVDLPGHGKSEGIPLESVERMSEWVMDVLDATKTKKASIVGHSLGSLVALQFAASHPEAAEKIALIGTAFPMKVSDAFLDAARRNDVAAHDMSTIWGHAPRVPFGGNPNPGMWMYGDMLARLARLAPGVLHADLKASNDYAKGLESAARVACPVLFIVGASDMMTPPRNAQALLDAMKQAKNVRLATSGHSLMAEAPDATLDALIGFLR